MSTFHSAETHAREAANSAQTPTEAAMAAALIDFIRATRSALDDLERKLKNVEHDVRQLR